MNKFFERLLFVLLGVALLGACIRSQPVWSRLQLAFGAPTEAERRELRARLRDLQARLATSRVLVPPVMWADGPERRWRRDWAQLLAAEMRPQTKATVFAGDAPPDVPRAEMRANQLRYRTGRAPLYASWVAASQPPADFVVCTEVFSHHDAIRVVFVFVLDGRGRVAYSGLIRPDGRPSPMQAGHLPLLARWIMTELQRDPLELHPPLGG